MGLISDRAEIIFKYSSMGIMNTLTHSLDQSLFESGSAVTDHTTLSCIQLISSFLVVYSCRLDQGLEQSLGGSSGTALALCRLPHFNFYKWIIIPIDEYLKLISAKSEW